MLDLNVQASLNTSIPSVTSLKIPRRCNIQCVSEECLSFLRRLTMLRKGEGQKGKCTAGQEH